MTHSLPSKADLAIFDFTESVVLVPSHLPTEEHTQEKISEDCEKEGFDIFISLLSMLLAVPSISLASCLMIHCASRLPSNKTFTFHKMGTLVKVKTEFTYKSSIVVCPKGMRAKGNFTFALIRVKPSVLERYTSTLSLE